MRNGSSSPSSQIRTVSQKYVDDLVTDFKLNEPTELSLVVTKDRGVCCLSRPLLQPTPGDRVWPRECRVHGGEGFSKWE
jgi:hypothetical protein